MTIGADLRSALDKVTAPGRQGLQRGSRPRCAGLPRRPGQRPSHRPSHAGGPCSAAADPAEAALPRPTVCGAGWSGQDGHVVEDDFGVVQFYARRRSAGAAVPGRGRCGHPPAGSEPRARER